MVGSCQRIRTTTARNSAEFAWRLPPRLSRWRLVVQDEPAARERPEDVAHRDVWVGQSGRRVERRTGGDQLEVGQRLELGAQLEPLTNFKLITACAAFDAAAVLSDPDVAMRYVLGTLARRWLVLHEEIKSHSRHLKARTTAAAPQLVAAFGIGPDIAAELLVAAGDNSNRIRSEAALAKLCGVCPIPASSGKTNRHRLNRGGNRQANSALFRAVVVRMRWHEPTIAYVERRTAEGLSKREIIRCLKRYLAREVFQLLPPPSTTVTELRAA